MNADEFQKLVDPHREPLRRFVTLMVGREADDIVQEAISVAFRQIARFEGRSKFSTWLYGISLHLSRKYLRDRRRHAIVTSESVLDAQPARYRGIVSSVIRH